MEIFQRDVREWKCSVGMEIFQRDVRKNTMRFIDGADNLFTNLLTYLCYILPICRCPILSEYHDDGRIKRKKKEREETEREKEMW